MGRKNPLTMMRFLFGEAAEAGQSGASGRLLAWCEAFEAWLEERGQVYSTGTVKQAKLAWKRALGQIGKMPWELGREEIEGHVRWMEKQRYSPATIGNTVGILASFYRWCGERGVDAELGAGFNPAEGVRRPQVGRWRGAKVLSRREASRLLRTAGRDESAVGKRDYAFLLGRLRLGVSLAALRELRWGQIELEGEGVWVRWEPEAERQALPGEAWEAIRAALEAGGRLGEMEAEEFVFAPLGTPGKAEAGSRREDWAIERCISSSQALASLKLYGRMAGIEENKLTQMALRRTAMRQRMEAGASTEEMQAFMGSREDKRFTKYRLRQLEVIEEKEGEEELEARAGAPDRSAKPFQPGEGLIHGYYAQSQPPAAVAAMAAENIQGIEEQIVGLRRLSRGLLERQSEAVDSEEAARLWEAYSLAAFRLGGLVKAEEGLSKEDKGSQWAEGLLESLDKISIMLGGEPISDGIRADALGSNQELAAASRSMTEELAALRYVLRNTFRLAWDTKETKAYIRYVEIYSSGSLRLARLLKMNKASSDTLVAYLEEGVRQAIEAVLEEDRERAENFRKQQFANLPDPPDSAG